MLHIHALILLVVAVTESNNINTLKPRQNGRHFADAIFKYIFLNVNVWISLKFSLTFVPEVLINNIPSLVPIMAWCRPGNKPLSEAMLIRLPTHICVTRPQWVNGHQGDMPYSTINSFTLYSSMHLENLFEIQIVEVCCSKEEIFQRHFKLTNGCHRKKVSGIVCQHVTSKVFLTNPPGDQAFVM